MTLRSVDKDVTEFATVVPVEVELIDDDLVGIVNENEGTIGSSGDAGSLTVLGPRQRSVRAVSL